MPFLFGEPKALQDGKQAHGKLMEVVPHSEKQRVIADPAGFLFWYWRTGRIFDGKSLVIQNSTVRTYISFLYSVSGKTNPGKNLVEVRAPLGGQLRQPISGIAPRRMASETADSPTPNISASSRRVLQPTIL
jgi:hypothetical protein